MDDKKLKELIEEMRQFSIRVLQGNIKHEGEIEVLPRVLDALVDIIQLR